MIAHGRLIPRAFGTRIGMVVALVAVGSFPVFAQDDEQSSETAEESRQSRIVPTIRTHIYDRLNEAQICMDEGDLDCALEVLERVAGIRDLNNYEIAQMWNFRAFIYFDLDNVDGAIEAYEMILDLPREDIPEAIIQSSMRNLATLYLQEERLQDGLDTFLAWMELPGVIPSSDDYYLVATIYYQMERYADGIPPVQRAIEMANEQGSIGEENWYQLLYVFYFQLEQVDNVIDTLTFMVEHWTKRDWVLALAGQLSGQGRDNDTLTLYEAAYDAGWLTRGTEWVQLANLHLNADSPYKAAVLLDAGLSDGTIDSTQSNWRLLAQAWQLAAEHELALPALRRASSLADDGEVDRLLTQSLVRLARWEECAEAGRSALDRGVDREDLVYLQLGNCLYQLRELEESQAAFRAAGRDERSAADARRWVDFVETEMARERANAEALASLQNN